MLVPNLFFLILVPNCLFAFLVPNCLNCPFLLSGVKLSVAKTVRVANCLVPICLVPNCPLPKCPTTHRSATKRNWSKNCVANDTFILLGKIAQRQPSLFLSRPHHFIFAPKLSFIPLFTWCYKNPTSLTVQDDFWENFARECWYLIPSRLMMVVRHCLKTCFPVFLANLEKSNAILLEIFSAFFKSLDAVTKLK